MRSFQYIKFLVCEWELLLLKNSRVLNHVMFGEVLNMIHTGEFLALAFHDFV
jgi:hypothetical protein